MDVAVKVASVAVAATSTVEVERAAEVEEVAVR